MFVLVHLSMLTDNSLEISSKHAAFFREGGATTDFIGFINKYKNSRKSQWCNSFPKKIP